LDSCTSLVDPGYVRSSIFEESLLRKIEIFPIFTRLELEHGRWVPRHWPPNLGAPRDIPHGARIHRSVYNLHQAGILKSLPKTGGDESHVRPASLLFALNGSSETRQTHRSNFSDKFKSILGWNNSTESSSKDSVSSILSSALSNGTASL
jgi:hypothetical protein